MSAGDTSLRIGVLMVAAYLLLAWLSLLATGPADVTLIWPSSGIIYAALLYFGARWWPLPVICVLLTHWLLAPVPASFLPWSVASNLIGGLAGWWLVRRIAPDALRRYDVPAGSAILVGGALMALLSGLLGGIGMWASGQSALAELPGNAVRWAVGDLFGIIVMVPLVLVTLEHHFRRNRLLNMRLAGYATPMEQRVWLTLLVLILLGTGWLTSVGQGHALAVIGLPLGALVWAAVRMPPTPTLLANALVVLLVSTAAGMGYAGPPPASPLDAATLSAFLAVIAVIPITLSLGLHQSRVAAARLLERANTDALTGTLSRSAFEYRLRRALGGPDARRVALAYIDLDRFRLVNDALSHAVGDELICAVAGVLRANVRPGDELARTGGDEFALLMHGATPAAALNRAERLCAAVSSYRFHAAEHVAAPTISVGLVHADGMQGNFGALLALADTACYAAKQQGGNRVQQAAPGQRDIVQRSSDTMRWALRIGHALEHDHFRLYCQSIAALAPGRDVPGRRHFEVLLRLQEPGEPLAMPDQFIPAAERYGQAVRLDAHVVDKILEWFVHHPQAARCVDLCAINLSASSLQDESFLEHLQRRLEEGPLQPEQLCFELTETSALSDLARARHFIAAVRALGCRFALDDFGTGFCSFGYLRSLEVDYFKIDGSFVRDVDSSPLADAVVRSITEIGRVMQKQTIAECTESPAVRERLTQLGVDYAQGWAVDRPQPIAQYFATCAQAPA